MTPQQTVELTFDQLGLAPKLLEILYSKKFINPTPIQHQCIPQAIAGKDVVGIAQTGTGKTLAFGLPIIQRLAQVKGQALILVPTRELAIQVNDMLDKIGYSLGLKTALIIGGVPIDKQLRDFRKNPHIVIATPGRLIAHLNDKNYSLKNISIVVLDEADRMLDIGFLPDIKRLLALCPKERQTLLFSATMPPAIAQIASQFMKLPLRIEVAPSGTSAAGVEQEVFVVEKQAKLSLLEKVLQENPGSALVFCRTKYGAKKTSQIVRAMGHSAAEIHSNRSLGQRREALSGFKSGKYRVLVATDIAARGIDVSNIATVINYDLPENSEDYVHRIGRTGRAGASGKAISFATPDQRNNIRQIERLIRKSIPILNLPQLSQNTAVMRLAGKFDPKREDRGRRFSGNKKPFRSGRSDGRNENGHSKTGNYRRRGR